MDDNFYSKGIDRNCLVEDHGVEAWAVPWYEGYPFVRRKQG